MKQYLNVKGKDFGIMIHDVDGFSTGYGILIYKPRENDMTSPNLEMSAGEQEACIKDTQNGVFDYEKVRQVKVDGVVVWYNKDSFPEKIFHTGNFRQPYRGRGNIEVQLLVEKSVHLGDTMKFKKGNLELEVN